MNDNKKQQINSLCNKFNKEIFYKEYNDLENIVKEIEKFSEGKDTAKYFRIVIEFYRDFNNSLKLYDTLILNLSFNKYLSEGYHYSVKIESKLNKIHLSVPYPWTALNPSIINNQNEFILNVRSSNYRILPGGNYTSLENDKVIRTRNFIKILDNNFKEKKTYEIVEPERYLKRDWGIKGFEDVRIFNFNDTLKFLTATYDTHNLKCQRVVMADILKEEIENIINLNIPEIKRHTEKNWLPFQHDDKILCVYSYSPFIILDLTEPNRIKIKSNKKIPYNFSSFRGSASPIKYNDGYICVIHQVYTEYDNRKIYVNRLIYFNKTDFNIKKISHQFYFQKHQIEFCCGLCIKDEDNFIFTYGVNDEDAYMSIVKKDLIDKMLYDI